MVVDEQGTEVAQDVTIELDEDLQPQELHLGNINIELNEPK